jgi:acyl carrier protein
MNNVETRLARCFAAVFPKLSPERIRAATPETVAEWDSVATVTLLTVIEEEFGRPVDIDDEAQELMSFESLCRRLGTL